MRRKAGDGSRTDRRGKQRYPWASQITDYVPVGRWRRIGVITAGVGFAWFILGAATVFVIRKSVQLKGGLPHSGLVVGGLWPGHGPHGGRFRHRCW